MVQGMVAGRWWQMVAEGRRGGSEFVPDGHVYMYCILFLSLG